MNLNNNVVFLADLSRKKAKIQKLPIGYKYPAEALLAVPSGSIYSWFPPEGWGYVVVFTGGLRKMSFIH